MYASVRRYKGVDPRAFDEATRNRQSLEATMRKAPGFRAWYLIRTSDGLVTVTLCDEQAGAEESVRLAGSWLRDTIPGMVPNPPEVANGEVVLQLGS
jgi:hypothetical protein